MKEILKNLVETTTLPEDSYLDQDAEILEIFVEEIEEIFVELNALFPEWLSNPDHQENLKTIRRHFHTLKGSGRMVGAKSAGEMAWAVEDTLNRVLSGSIQLTPTVQKFAQAVLNVYQYALYPKFKHVQQLDLDLRPMVLLGQQLQQQISPEPALEELLALADHLTAEGQMTGLELTENEPSEVELTIAPVEVPVRSDIEETVAIFIEEAEEHLETIATFLRTEDEKSQDYNALIRAIHTLRGSSSMAQIDQIFEASSKVEHLFKTLLQDEIVSTSKETALLIQYAEFVSDYLHLLRQGNTAKLDAVYATFERVWNNYGFAVIETNSIQTQGLVSKLVELDIDLLLDAEFEFDKRAQVDYPEYIQALSQQAAELLAHTESRAAQGIHEFTADLKSAYDALLEKPVLLNSDYAYELFAQAHQEFIHLFDTLAAGQRVILNDEIQKILSELSAFVQQDLEIFAEDTSNQNIELSSEATQVAETVAPGSVDFAGLSQRIAADRQQQQSTETNRDFDEELLSIFLEEADELLAGIDEDLNTWSKKQDDTTSLNNLMRHLHTLKGGANMIAASHIGLIAHELESIYERVIRQQIAVTPALIQIIRLVQDNVSDRIQSIREDGIDYPAPEAIAILQNIQALVSGQAVAAVESANTGVKVAEVEATSISEPQLEESATTEQPATDLAEAEELLEISKSSEAIEDTPVERSEEDELKSIVEESFLEESEEILANAEKLLNQWFDQRSDRSLLLQLQRAAHSIKGGARMIDVEEVASIAYELETTFEQFAVYQFNSNAYDGLLQKTLVWLRQAIFQRDYNGFDQLHSSLKKIAYVDVTAQLPERLAKTDNMVVSTDFGFVEGDGTEPPQMMGEWANSGTSDSNNEMIRISADLVEKMIDLSGENSINRSRIEMDLGQLGNTLNEMELAIKRLADQLRRMEGELESQIIAKHGSENSRYADFDPLEMDQYSSLNQLSKSLAESASDLVDFKSTLADKVRETEGLLLQQSRIQAEIQESLMRTRLVPFDRMLPRLQRIVRQTSTTLNRPAELIVQNTEGELDRNILERLVTPFEHMLRNAIDHGLEDTADRIALNKPEVGSIVLNISRQGTDVIVSFSDDGKGIDAEKIREKALSLDLIKADQVIDQEEILQFIFHPGFSTAKAVTQISGRGVGLDVVQSEIKSLGGHVSVSSELGKGTVFTIRVPTTVAVSDALMVKVGDQQYAISLAQIDRIVRIAPTTLESYFNSKDDYFKIDGANYKLRYLSEFVGNQPIPRLNNVGHSLPVLLIKGNSGQTIALLVDQLVGSRAQIVVKPIGQQFANVGVVAGATILGDGQVCLILDGQNVARQIQATQRVKQLNDQRDGSRNSNARRLVMIVDDSVTVRKVTSRLLERQGYDIVTAKDGVDAIEQLENVRPDLMLLDIEMPRMDGFEVTNLVRHHDIHRDLPIIMITSRTGEKHRERAFSLGVTHYMGKPFQEAELLANIQQLIAEKQR
ncbi:Hpt domain-containing protein [Acinetobacter lwoffii]|jgi:chemotaxis protein histidine kinase CheA/ActR/RegA family two-component response regulator|uniref:hybrid sensor histidine kinase/response regulator n=1 Tax=Acinetobacter lwoffii TaxID=28090 RepID=UPI00086E959E|nr:Hpt domain-containing protein [Acinetobacter lwoffii]ODN54651.1 hybrid sensor histidine kinase/response regulator [Acinetobacter sp. 51m]QXB86094.1 Hpt domain-containing protein [Acinetobacter lwoffii]QZM11391.1 Signal transduction histidine kinase CheA [Acinetobacter lwoffii]